MASSITSVKVKKESIFKPHVTRVNFFICDDEGNLVSDIEDKEVYSFTKKPIKVKK